MTDERIELAAGGDAAIRAQLLMLRDTFRDACGFGSLLRVPALPFDELLARLEMCGASDAIRPIVRQAQLLAQKYDVVMTNPPYMGAAGMRAQLSAFVRKNYPDSKADLCAAFIERCGEMLRENGYLAMLTQHAWMFLTGFERLRRKLLQKDIVSMAHLGAHAFEELGGEVVQTTAFVLSGHRTPGFRGTYCRLTAPKTPQEKARMPAYWLRPAMRSVFRVGQPLHTLAAPKQGIATADNARFLRLWFEVCAEDLFLHCPNHARSAASDAKWYPYNKGGSYRKWYGNNDYVIFWQHDGEALRSFPRAVLRNPEYYFRECISWSLISSRTISFRYKPCGHLFDVAGMSCFALPSSDVPLLYLLALNNSCLIDSLMEALAPTLNFQVGNIADIPVLFDNAQAERICALAQENIDLARQDWDAFETSWDFKRHPLV